MLIYFLKFVVVLITTICTILARESNSVVRHERRMRQRPTGVNNCLFFVLNAELADDVYSLADRIVAMALEKPCCRTLQRVLPVEVTCQVNMPVVNRVSSHFSFVLLFF